MDWVVDLLCSLTEFHAGSELEPVTVVQVDSSSLPSSKCREQANAGSSRAILSFYNPPS